MAIKLLNKPMFQSAVIKLTVIYTLIVLVVTVTLSTYVYLNILRITDDALRVQRERIERRLQIGDLGKPQNRASETRMPLFQEEALLEIRELTLQRIAIINFVIFLITIISSYYFASRTLKPIEIAHKKQERFISNAAHEMKTPLTVIKTNLEVQLKDPKFNFEKAKSTIKETILEVDKFNKFVNDLIKQYKYSQNGYNHPSAQIDVVEIVRNIIKKYRDYATSKNVKIELQDKSIHKIYANEAQLSEVIGIILDNAIKFSNQNGVVKIKTYSNKMGTSVEIKDYGIGIARSELNHIFDTFYQVDASRTDSHQNGYGLGLSIAKEIIDSNHWKISVQSELKKGTRFRLILPRK